MTDEDRAVAAESGDEAIEEVARDGSAYRLRLVAHDPAAYDWYYNVVANPTLWFLQHYLWALAYAPDIDPGLHHAWDERLRPRQPGLRRRRARRARGASPTRPSSFTTTTSTSRRASSATRARTRRSATSSTSPGRAELLARPPRAHPRRGPRRPARERRRRLPRGPLAAELPSLEPRHRSRPSATSTAASARHRRPEDARHRAADLRRRRGVRRARRERRRCCARGASDRGAPARVPHPARRPHRPVEERRARLPRVRALPRRASRRCTAGWDARSSRSVAAGHPRVRGVPRGDPARGARRERPLPARRLDAGRPPDRATTSRSRSPRTSNTTSCS